jgi:hypothetical protein
MTHEKIETFLRRQRAFTAARIEHLENVERPAVIAKRNHRALASVDQRLHVLRERLSA